MDCNKGRTVDLHIHSTASDGSLQPKEIIDLSVQVGLSAISLTDHDSVDGCREIAKIPGPLPIEFLPGVEISADFPPEYPLTGSLHILGYAIDINHPDLNRLLQNLQDARNQRSPKIIQRLNALGFPLTIEEVTALAEGDQIGRPHIARALQARGWVQSVDEAFDNYLGKQAPAYVEKKRLACGRALELIIEAGGIPVLAHPGLLDLEDRQQLETFLPILIDKGLRGIEVLYPEHTREEVAYYNKLAARYNLLKTGGTDFHGALNPEIKLGTGTGNLHVSYRLYATLINYAKKQTSS